MIALKLNGNEVRYDGDPTMPLLWFLRDVQGLTGTRFGCGVAQCGACTVHVNGEPRRSCVTPVSILENAEVTTIEGVSGKAAQAVQAAWIASDVPQCGCCQSGQIMSAVALLSQLPKPTDRDIDLAMNGNICRCCTYQRIRAATPNRLSALWGPSIERGESKKQKGRLKRTCAGPLTHRPGTSRTA